MRRHRVTFVAIAIAGAALDLLTKHLAFEYIPVHGEQKVIDGLFTVGRTLNPGIIFGKFGGSPALWLVVSILAVPAILAIYFSVKKPKAVLDISLGMILAGTIGNMVDRVFVGAVRDFIKFYLVVDGREKVWPLFNLADSFICVGVFLLSVEMVFFEEKKKKQDEPPPIKAPEPPGAGVAVEGK
jgi:signal peptidase II